MHGGKSPGAPKRNINAARPGSIYSQYLTPDEQAIESSIGLGSVDAELRLMRIRLMRALAAETNTPELDEIIEREGAESVAARSEQKFRRRDYAGLIDRLTARIESLERRRLELIALQKQIDEGAGALDMGENDTVVLRPDDDIPEAPIL